MNIPLCLAATLVVLTCIESCQRPNLIEHRNEISQAVCPIYIEAYNSADPNQTRSELLQAGTGFFVGITVDGYVRILLMSAAHVFADINCAKNIKAIYLGIPTKEDTKVINLARVPSTNIGDAYPFPLIDMSYCEITEAAEAIERLYDVSIKFIPLDENAQQNGRSIKDVHVIDGERFKDQGIKCGAYGFTLVADPKIIKRIKDKNAFENPIKLLKSRNTVMTTNNIFQTSYGVKRIHLHDTADIEEFESGNSGGPSFAYGTGSKVYFSGILMGGWSRNKSECAIAPVYFMYKDLPGLIKKSSGK